MSLVSAAIRVDGLTKRYGDRLAVEDLSFEVAPGEVFGFLGPNGAGKTTTVRMLTTTIRPSAGEAQVAGIPVTAGTAPDLRRRIGVMPESAGLYGKLSVYDNLEFFAGLYGLGRPEADRRIAAALDVVGLAARRNDRAATLSKGLKQRTALARTLLAEPEVLFLDEPTAGLDPESSLDVRGLIESLQDRGVTVFLTTHRLEEAQRLCDRVGIINTRLLSVGTPAELRRRMFGAALEVRLVAPLADPGSVFSAVPGVAGWEGDDARYRLEASDPDRAAPEVVRALVAAGADVVHVSQVAESLEDVYLQMVREGER